MYEPGMALGALGAAMLPGTANISRGLVRGIGRGLEKGGEELDSPVMRAALAGVGGQI
jgi:hypothetical protein